MVKTEEQKVRIGGNNIMKTSEKFLTLFTSAVLALVAVLAVVVFLFDHRPSEPITAISKEDLYFGTYTCEEPGFGGRFTITINKDWTFSFYEGGFSSYLGHGFWEIQENRLLLRDNGSSHFRDYYFYIKDGCLVFDKESSHQFIYMDELPDGTRFLPESQTTEAWLADLDKRSFELDKSR